MLMYQYSTHTHWIPHVPEMQGICLLDPMLHPLQNHCADQSWWFALSQHVSNTHRLYHTYSLLPNVVPLHTITNPSTPHDARYLLSADQAKSCTSESCPRKYLTGRHASWLTSLLPNTELVAAFLEYVRPTCTHTDPWRHDLPPLPITLPDNNDIVVIRTRC